MTPGRDGWLDVQQLHALHRPDASPRKAAPHRWRRRLAGPIYHPQIFTTLMLRMPPNKISGASSANVRLPRRSKRQRSHPPPSQHLSKVIVAAGLSESNKDARRDRRGRGCSSMIRKSADQRATLDATRGKSVRAQGWEAEVREAYVWGTHGSWF